MGININDLDMTPGLKAAIDRALAKEAGAQKVNAPAEAKKKWIARSPLLRMKPIVSSDPHAFIAMVEQIRQQNPGLTLYLFEVTLP